MVRVPDTRPARWWPVAGQTFFKMTILCTKYALFWPFFIVFLWSLHLCLATARFWQNLEKVWRYRAMYVHSVDTAAGRRWLSSAEQAARNLPTPSMGGKGRVVSGGWHWRVSQGLRPATWFLTHWPPISILSLFLLQLKSFTHSRINLSPFTKDFRVWETFIETVTISLWALFGELPYSHQ